MVFSLVLSTDSKSVIKVVQEFCKFEEDEKNHVYYSDAYSYCGEPNSHCAPILRMVNFFWTQDAVNEEQEISIFLSEFGCKYLLFLTKFWKSIAKIDLIAICSFLHIGTN